MESKETKNAADVEAPLVYAGMPAAKADELARHLSAECIEALTPDVYRMVMAGGDPDCIGFRVVAPEPPPPPREYPLGFNMEVKPGRAKVASRPAIRLDVKRLFIPGSTHEHFIIRDILVRDVPQFAKHKRTQTTDGSGHTWVYIALDRAEVADNITFLVKNTSKQHRRFRAALLGFAARD